MVEFWTTDTPTRPDCTHYCRIKVEDRGYEGCGPDEKTALARAVKVTVEQLLNERDVARRANEHNIKIIDRLKRRMK